MCKTILITGGTGKIGHQLVEHFYKNGLRVIFTSRSNAKLLTLINDRKNIIGIQVDLEHFQKRLIIYTQNEQTIQ